MGVRGLAKIIKDTKGELAHDLRTKHVHVDLLSLYFPLIQHLCFRALSSGIAKDVRSSVSTVTPSAVVITTTSTSEVEYIEQAPVPGGNPRKRCAAVPEGPRKNPRSLSDLPTDIKNKRHEPKLFMGEDGRITHVPPPEKNTEVRLNV
jgi:hypothetical protein